MLHFTSHIHASHSLPSLLVPVDERDLEHPCHHPGYPIPNNRRGYLRPDDMRGSVRDVAVRLTREDLCNHADPRSQRPSIVTVHTRTASFWHTDCSEAVLSKRSPRACVTEDAAHGVRRTPDLTPFTNSNAPHVLIHSGWRCNDDTVPRTVRFRRTSQPSFIRCEAPPVLAQAGRLPRSSPSSKACDVGTRPSAPCSGSCSCSFACSRARVCSTRFTCCSVR